MDAWTIQDAQDQYLVSAWGEPYVDINESGHMVMLPRGPEGGSIDLKLLVDSLIRQGQSLPVLLRFLDVIGDRIEKIHQAFAQAKRTYHYAGGYQLVAPIKVNQQRCVLEEVMRAGGPRHVGLEAGSKAELIIALAMVDDPEALIICNGYKDKAYLEMAMLAHKIGRSVVIVLDRFEGLEPLITSAERLGVQPRIGLRARMNSKGSGRWIESAGERSKFGLSAAELLACVQRFSEANLLSKVELFHFHLGSQLTNIASIKNGLRESCRLYVDLCKLGAPLRYLDVGGGLAVDYDGSRTNFHSSANYSLQEYANDVVATVGDACQQAELEHPTLISESGRAVMAHHAVLIFDVLGVNSRGTGQEPRAPGPDDHAVHHLLYEAWTTTSKKTYQETFNDLIEYQQESLSLFLHGVLDLAGRAYAEELGWSVARKIQRMLQSADLRVPEEMEGLEKAISDTCFCNFSVFQSAPDLWAVQQLLPVMPIHRLEQRPSRPSTLADLTCDSDGKIDRFIDLHDVRDTLLLHAPNGEPYYLGLFMVGAYQEILGDLHNLFGEPTSVHIRLDENGYSIEDVRTADTVAEAVGFLGWDRQTLVDRLRRASELALRRNEIGDEDVRVLMSGIDRGLSGPTYPFPEES